MVLDHLVVQSIDAEHEEGDIDSVLLHGTAALYENEVDGVAPSDVVYNSKNVDEMIDRVEKEAEDMAVAKAEKDRLESEAEARGERKDASKEAKSFGFAKIWEANQSGLRDMEDEADQEEMNEEDLNEVILRARADRLKREKEEIERNGVRYRNAKSGPTQQDTSFADLFSDGEPEGDTPKKAKKGEKAGKRKKGAEESDDEFAPARAGSDSDGTDMEDAEVEPEAVVGEDGVPVILGDIQPAPLSGLAGPAPPPKKRKYTKHPKAGFNAADAVGGPSKTANGQTVNGNGETAYMRPSQVAALIRPGYAAPALAPAEEHMTKAEKKMAKNKSKAEERRKSLASGAVVQMRAQVVAAQGARSGQPLPTRPRAHPLAHRPGGPSATKVIHQLSASEAIAFGRYIVQWMYHLLRQFGFVKEVNHWARAAMVELDLTVRRDNYKSAADKVDAQLVKTGGQPYFGLQMHKEAVYALISSKEQWIPDYLGPAMQEYPAEAAVAGSSVRNGIGSAEVGENAAGPSRIPVNRELAARMSAVSAVSESQGSLPQIPAGSGVNGDNHRLPASNIGVAAAGTSSNAKQATAASTLRIDLTPVAATTNTPSAGPSSSKARMTDGIDNYKAAASTLAAAGSETSAASTHQPTLCPMCSSAGHTFTDCPDKPPFSMLETFKATVLKGNGAPEEKVCPCRRVVRWGT